MAFFFRRSALLEAAMPTLLSLMVPPSSSSTCSKVRPFLGFLPAKDVHQKVIVRRCLSLIVIRNRQVASKRIYGCRDCSSWEVTHMGGQREDLFPYLSANFCPAHCRFMYAGPAFTVKQAAGMLHDGLTDYHLPLPCHTIFP